MFKKEFLQPLKAYTTNIYTKEIICTVFPNMLAQLCRMTSVINFYGYPQQLHFNPEHVIEFTNNLGCSIHQENYDLLDNIILKFFKEYYYMIPINNKYYRFVVDFNEEATNKFVETCNNFKGKQWDDIISPFLDSLYEFLNTITIHGDPLV